MQVSFETIIRRAAAEGYTLSKVKSALARLEREARSKAIQAAQEGWHGVEVVGDDAVVRQLTSTRYCGGFIYPGSVATPGNFQARWGSRPGDSTDGDEVGATKWVTSAPIGAEVIVDNDFGNGRSLEVFRKLAQGWALVHTWHERDVRWAENGVYLYTAPADVAHAVGCGESATFYALFDLAAKQLLD